MKEDIRLGQILTEKRRKHGITQEELAALVDISPAHISIIERGTKIPRLDTFVSIANALQVSSDSLLVDVADHAVSATASDLSVRLTALPHKEQLKILRILEILLEN